MSGSLKNTAQAFGRVMKKMRVARKLSQSELAGLSELDRTFISLLERGLRQPTLSTIFVLSKALRVSPGNLVGQAERGLKTVSRRAGPRHRL